MTNRSTSGHLPPNWGGYPSFAWLFMQLRGLESIQHNCPVPISIVQGCQLFDAVLNFAAKIGIFDANSVMLVFDDLGGTFDITDIHVSGEFILTALVGGQQQSP